MCMLKKVSDHGVAVWRVSGGDYGNLQPMKGRISAECYQEVCTLGTSDSGYRKEKKDDGSVRFFVRSQDFDDVQRTSKPTVRSGIPFYRREGLCMSMKGCSNSTKKDLQ